MPRKKCPSLASCYTANHVMMAGKKRQRLLPWDRISVSKEGTSNRANARKTEPTTVTRGSFKVSQTNKSWFVSVFSAQTFLFHLVDSCFLLSPWRTKHVQFGSILKYGCNYPTATSNLLLKPFTPAENRARVATKGSRLSWPEIPEPPPKTTWVSTDPDPELPTQNSGCCW